MKRHHIFCASLWSSNFPLWSAITVHKGFDGVESRAANIVAVEMNLRRIPVSASLYTRLRLLTRSRSSEFWCRGLIHTQTVAFAVHSQRIGIDSEVTAKRTVCCLQIGGRWKGSSTTAPLKTDSSYQSKRRCRQGSGQCPSRCSWLGLVGRADEHLVQRSYRFVEGVGCATLPVMVCDVTRTKLPLGWFPTWH